MIILNKTLITSLTLVQAIQQIPNHLPEVLLVENPGIPIRDHQIQVVKVYGEIALQKAQPTQDLHHGLILLQDHVRMDLHVHPLDHQVLTMVNV